MYTCVKLIYVLVSYAGKSSNQMLQRRLKVNKKKQYILVEKIHVFLSQLGPRLAISTSRVLFMSAAFSKLGELSWALYQAFRCGAQSSSNSSRNLWNTPACYWVPLQLLHGARKVFLQAPWIVTQKSNVLWNIFQSLTSLPPSLQSHPLSPCSGRCSENMVLAAVDYTITCICSVPLADVLQGRSQGHCFPTCSREKGNSGA